MFGVLGFWGLIDDNWTSLNADDINTGRVFFKHMFDIIDGQLKSRGFFKDKVEEVRIEKLQAL